MSHGTLTRSGIGEENSIACLFDLSVPFPFFSMIFRVQVAAKLQI